MIQSSKGLPPGNHVIEFSPVPSVAGIFSAPLSTRFYFMIGPIGSTKTSTALNFLLSKAAMQEPSPDGYRRTRFGIIRNTLSGIKQTVLQDILNLFGPIAQWRPSANTVYFRIGDIRSDWMMIPLETPDDVRRLGSLQLSAVFINECREVPFDMVMAAFSRTGRYPSPKAGGVNCTHRFLIADSNLGVEGSDLYKALEEDETRLDNLCYIHQPSALSPEADWTHLLPENYYQDAMKGASPQWVRQHILSEWGHDLSGEPVYGATFDWFSHVAPKPLRAKHDRPLIIAVDPGLNPAALVGQVQPNGQLWILREFHASNMLFRPFLTDIVFPGMQTEDLYGCATTWVLDPAGKSANAMTVDTPKGVMMEYGLDVRLALTNEIGPRLRSVERWLVDSRTGWSDDPVPVAGRVSALLIDPRCLQVIKGFQGGYRYLRNNKQELQPQPEKKHPISDVHDCLQYICLALSGRQMQVKVGFTPERVNRAPPGQFLGGSMGSAGWT